MKPKELRNRWKSSGALQLPENSNRQGLAARDLQECYAGNFPAFLAKICGAKPVGNFREAAF